MINLNQYLLDYLPTNNAKVAGYIPVFIELAIANVNKTLRAAFTEKNDTELTLPSDFTAMRYVSVNGVRYSYSGDAQDSTFNIIANELVVSPSLGDADELNYTYFAVNEQVLTSYSPQLLLHAAAMEAYLFIGDNDTASVENATYTAMLDACMGWDSHGTMSMGSGVSAAAEFTKSSVQIVTIDAINVNVTPTGTITSPNVQAALGELDSDIQSLAGSITGFATLNSPAFTGNPTAPTPTAGDNDTSIATTQFVTTAIGGITGYAPINSPTLTGDPKAPTPTAGDDDTSIATTAFVTTAVTPTVKLTGDQTVAGIKTFTSKLAVTSSISANASEGTAGQVLKSGGAGQPAVWGDLPASNIAFSARIATSQTVTASTYTKIAAAQEEFDYGGYYDTTAARFTPLVAGVYDVKVHLCNPVATSTIAALYKNGAFHDIGNRTDNVNSSHSSVLNILVDMNGTTDYLEAFGFTSTTSFTSGAGGVTRFQAVLVRKHSF